MLIVRAGINLRETFPEGLRKWKMLGIMVDKGFDKVKLDKVIIMILDAVGLTL